MPLSLSLAAAVLCELPRSRSLCVCVLARCVCVSMRHKSTYCKFRLFTISHSLWLDAGQWVQDAESLKTWDCVGFADFLSGEPDRAASCEHLSESCDTDDRLTCNNVACVLAPRICCRKDDAATPLCWLSAALLSCSAPLQNASAFTSATTLCLYLMKGWLYMRYEEWKAAQTA